MALKTILCTKKYLVFFSAETTMHWKVTCILYKKHAHFSQFFCLQVRSVAPWQEEPVSDFAFLSTIFRLDFGIEWVFFLVCIVTVCVFVSSILFWFPQRTHYFWRVFRFLRRHSSILYSPSGFFSSYFINEVNF
jgi:hypothetical protein